MSDLLRELASRFAPGCIRPGDMLQMEPFTQAELSAIHDALLIAAAPSVVISESVTSLGPKYDESDRALVLVVSYDGSELILPREARECLWDYFDDWDYEGVTLTFKLMTRTEIEALPEFEGF